jgi:hypothetical protein
LIAGEKKATQSFESTEPGQLLWDFDKDPRRVYIRCQDGFVSFSELTTPIGKMNSETFMKKVLRKKRASDSTFILH